MSRDKATNQLEDYSKEHSRPPSPVVVVMDPPIGGRLRWSQRIGYGLGHVLNDLCASMWFTYLLLFFHKVLKFDNFYSGVILLVGQVADGLATTFVGICSDQGDALFLCARYGKRKAWHLIGTACVLASFPFIFLPCIGCQNADCWAQLPYYAAFVIIFQFGWASVQISHLSLIPDLTDCQNERTGLTAIRYGATVTSNICVYILTALFLGIAAGTDTVLGPHNAKQFAYIMISCLSIGAFASLLFHLLVKPPEKPDEPHMNSCDAAIATAEPLSAAATDADAAVMSPPGSAAAASRTVAPMRVLDWFGEPQFYIIAGVYMSTRLFVNLTQAYIPLFLQVTLKRKPIYVAIIPLVMYVAGFFTSTVMKPINRVLGRKFTFVLGCGLAVAGCVWIKLGCSSKEGKEIYGVAVLLGSGGSVMLITSLSLTAELIARNADSAAFVYGAMSLTDKLSNGLAVVVIQHLIPSEEDDCPTCAAYFRQVLFLVCGGAAVLGVLTIAALAPCTVGKRWRDTSPSSGQRGGGGGAAIAAKEARRRRPEPAASVNGDEPDETSPLIRRCDRTPPTADA